MPTTGGALPPSARWVGMLDDVDDLVDACLVEPAGQAWVRAHQGEPQVATSRCRGGPDQMAECRVVEHRQRVEVDNDAARARRVERPREDLRELGDRRDIGIAVEFDHHDVAEPA